MFELITQIDAVGWFCISGTILFVAIFAIIAYRSWDKGYRKGFYDGHKEGRDYEQAIFKDKLRIKKDDSSLHIDIKQILTSFVSGDIDSYNVMKHMLALDKIEIKNMPSSVGKKSVKMTTVEPNEEGKMAPKIHKLKEPQIKESDEKQADKQSDKKQEETKTSTSKSQPKKKSTKKKSPKKKNTKKKTEGTSPKEAIRSRSKKS